MVDSDASLCVRLKFTRRRARACPNKDALEDEKDRGVDMDTEEYLPGSKIATVVKIFLRTIGNCPGIAGFTNYHVKQNFSCCVLLLFHEQQGSLLALPQVESQKMPVPHTRNVLCGGNPTVTSTHKLVVRTCPHEHSPPKT